MGLPKGPRGPSRVVYCLAIALLPLAPDAFTQEGSQADPAGDEIRCPECGEDGKARCATCDGKGELFRVCPACQGSGQKPFSVCSEDGDAEGKGSGRVPCETCGGRGSFASGKTCPTCGGGQTLPCTACGEKGLVACKKLLPDRLCPDCRFVGKVTCPLCGGDRKASAQEIAVWRARRAPPRTPPAGRTTAAAGDDVATASRRDASAPVQGVQIRLARLQELDAGFLDVFAQDPSPRLNLLRKDALGLQRRLGAWKEIDPAHAESIARLLDRLDNLRERWKSLRTLFDETHRTIEKTRSAAATREARLLETRGATRLALEGQLNNQLEVLLGIAEKNAAKLSREEPDFLPREIAAVTAAWTPLQEGAQAALVAAETAAAERKTALAAARKAEEKQRAAAAATKPRAAGAQGRPPRPDDEAPRLPTRRAVVAEVRADRSAGDDTELETRPASPGSKSGGFPGIVLIGLGCVLALAVGWFVSRGRSRGDIEDSEEESSPGAVS